MKRAKADIKQYSIDHEPIRWANAHLTLAEHALIYVLEYGGRTRAADIGIEHMDEALKVITEENSTQSFVPAQAVLARMYPKRMAGNRTENLTKALAAANTALRVGQHPCPCSPRPPCPPSFVAEMYTIMGSIYADPHFESNDSRAANEDLAIRHYLASLQLSPMHEDNENWADRQLEVGVIYFGRKNGKPRSNVKVAIKHLGEALKVFTESEHPDKWAKTHQWLASSYSELIRLAFSLLDKSNKEVSEISALMEKWIASSTNAMQVFSPTHNPKAW
jgi:hypothetical protein